MSDHSRHEASSFCQPDGHVAHILTYVHTHRHARQSKTSQPQLVQVVEVSGASPSPHLRRPPADLNLRPRLLETNSRTVGGSLCRMLVPGWTATFAVRLAKRCSRFRLNKAVALISDRLLDVPVTAVWMILRMCSLNPRSSAPPLLPGASWNLGSSAESWALCRGGSPWPRVEGCRARPT